MFLRFLGESKNDFLRDFFFDYKVANKLNALVEFDLFAVKKNEDYNLQA